MFSSHWECLPKRPNCAWCSRRFGIWIFVQYFALQYSLDFVINCTYRQSRTPQWRTSELNSKKSRSCYHELTEYNKQKNTQNNNKRKRKEHECDWWNTKCLSETLNWSHDCRQSRDTGHDSRQLGGADGDLGRRTGEATRQPRAANADSADIGQERSGGGKKCIKTRFHERSRYRIFGFTNIETPLN